MKNLNKSNVLTSIGSIKGTLKKKCEENNLKKYGYKMYKCSKSRKLFV